MDGTHAAEGQAPAVVGQQPAAQQPAAQQQQPAPAPAIVPDAPVTQSQFAQMLALMQNGEQRQAAYEAQATAAAAAAKAEALVREEKARAAAAIASLQKAQSKETARFITAVSSEPNASNRATLAAATIEQLSMAEADEPLEERHASLRAKIKTMQGLSVEQQDALFNDLKAIKRKPEAAAASSGCSTCGRANHSADKCYATTTANGDPIPGAGAKRARNQGAMQQQQQPQFQGQQLFFPPSVQAVQQMMQQQAFAQQQQQQQQQQQHQLAAAAAAAAAAGGVGGQAPIRCFHCQVLGHKSFQCPLKLQGAAGAGGALAARPGAGGAGGAANNPIVTVVRNSAHTRTARAEEQQLAQDAHRSMMISRDLCVAKLNTDSNAVKEPIQVKDTAAAAAAAAASVDDDAMLDAEVASSVAASSVIAAAEFRREDAAAIFNSPDRDDSEASAYAAGSWDVEDESEENEERRDADSTREEGGMRSCAAAELYSSTLEGTRADSKSIHSNIDLTPVLSSKMETPATLAALALQGEKMPERTQSLRGAIERGFGSKKKMLSDEEVMRQTCERCGKVGHTGVSCPDQTQRAAADNGAEDAWVRRLINLPRVDVLAENAGLTLEQGVAKWRAKGEELNRGNPWAGSTKMEDSLKKQLGYHKAMGMGSVHLGWIGFGIPLQFIREKHPAPLAFRNHASAMEEESFVDAEHASNVKDGSFVKVPRSLLRGICPLQVVKHPVSGKRRLVQDLRWINGHLPNVKFRMESLHKELGDVVQMDDKMLTTDIAKAYYCLAMHPDAQPYLGWEWKGEFYMPTCLVFGLAPAPRIFTKIMRPMMAFFRSLGVRVLGMIDDYLWAAKEDRIVPLREAVRVVLPRLGWTFNAKCEWEPADEVLMLGMLINAKKFEVRAPEKKIQATLANIRMILAKQKAQPQRPVTIKDVQRVTGRLMSMMLALPGVRVFSRYLYQCLAVALEHNEVRKRMGMGLVWTLQLTRGAVEELEFWLQRLLTHNGLEINCRENQVQVLLWSDASDVGWGGEAAGAETRVRKEDVPSGPIASMASGALPFREIARSSTRRELVALLKVAKTNNIFEQIKGKRIRVIMDSQPALANLLKGGGPVPELCEAVREWVQFCEQHSIRPTYEWVERAQNWRADEASKLHSQQHTLKYAKLEEDLRRQLNAMPATQWRSRANHFVWGKVPLFLPMFHQIDARVEMIRSQLEEAIIVVPRWPAGGTNDWWRRIEQHSIARLRLGNVKSVYAEAPRTGHDDELEAFWLMGRRGEKSRAAAI